MPLNPTNQDKTGILLPNSIAPKFDTLFATGNKEWNPYDQINIDRTLSGTPDNTFDPSTDMTYLGAFRIPYFSSAEGVLDQKQTLAYNPPEVGGRNGANGSVFIGGVDSIAEVQVPTLSMASEVSQLNAATVLQNWVNIYQKSNVTPVGSETRRNGWLKIIGGKLFASWYANYTSDPNNTNLMIINDPTDLANTTVQGLLDMEGEDKVVRYIAEVPSALQASLGGTHLVGVDAGSMSIASRLSYGHSVYAFSPLTIQPADTTVSATRLIEFSSLAPIEGFSSEVQEKRTYYEGLLGMDLGEYTAIPVADRLDSLEYFALPPETQIGHIMSLATRSGCAFIPPNSNSLCFIGYNEAGRYGMGYKENFLNFTFGNGGWHPFDHRDKDNAIWRYNISDIINATAVDDISYIDYRKFDNNRWLNPVDQATNGGILGGDFDSASNRLYLFHYDAEGSTSVVSVYQL